MNDVTLFVFSLWPQYGNFVDNLRLYVKGGSGGMGLPRMGGQGGNGGDVWVVAKKDFTLKRTRDKFPHKRFIAGVGDNSRCVRHIKLLSLYHRCMI